MRKKPLFITLVSLLCFIEPLIKVLYFKATTHFDFAVILANLGARSGFKDIFEFWLLFPLAGLMIVKLRNWTYVTFIALMGYSIHSILNYEEYTWPYNADTPFGYNIGVAVMCFAVIVYFLLPETRRPFFDARVRWWEPMVRYDVDIPCALVGSFGSLDTNIINISKSGVFIADTDKITVGDNIRMDMVAFGEVLCITLVVKNKHKLKGQAGFGAQFYFQNLSQYYKVRSIVSKIKASKKTAQVISLAA